VNSGEGLN